MMSTAPYSYIDSVTALQEVADEFADCDWIAVDTEFVRDRTYYPKFCLLQLASCRGVACIDTLAIEELTPLDALLDDERMVKVFHAARQDLEILYRLRKRLPRPIFDTQVAAPFVGFPEQIGYASLVAELLHVRIEKMHTRTDWSARPLGGAQLQYAADDVIYLGLVYQTLRDQITELGRLDWVVEEIRHLEDPELYDPPPEAAWLRISGVASLDAAQAGVLKVLAAWREHLARRQDCPRNWLIKDELLLELAKQRPKSMADLKRVRGLDDRVAQRYGKALLQILHEAPVPSYAEALPPRTRATPDTPGQEALLDIFTAVVRLRAAEHSINPAILASRRDLRAFIESPMDSPLLQGWRKALVGDDLFAMIAGRKSLTVTQDRISLIDHG